MADMEIISYVLYLFLGIGLEYIQGGCVKIKEIDLNELTSR